MTITDLLVQHGYDAYLEIRWKYRGKYRVSYGKITDEHIRQICVRHMHVEVARWCAWSDGSGLIIDLL